MTLRYKLQNIKNSKKINFIVVGVGSEFPTFIAMKLREIFHNGDPLIPLLYLFDNDTIDD